MVTPTFDIGDNSRVRSIRTARTARTNDELMHYRLDVVAASAADTVHSAGGWLYDRAMAGWEVTVLLPSSCDSRPLRILGVKVMDLEAGFERTDSEPQSQASLAVSAEAYAADGRIREKVLKALNHRLTEVALWGDGWPLAVDRGMTRVQHVLSAAARTFKSYALEAAGIGCGTVDPAETMLYDMAACSRADLELVRLG
jgi:hypothetical protein